MPANPEGTTNMTAEQTAKPWWQKKWGIVVIALGALVVLGGILDAVGSDEIVDDLLEPTAVPTAGPDPTSEPTAGLDPTSGPTATEPTTADVFQPTNEGDAERPFWSTTFELVVPEGAWEPGRDGLYVCQPTNEAEYQLATDDGRTVDDSLVFGRTDSALSGDDCIVRVVAVGDFTVLSDDYVISNGTFSAEIAAPELFAGEDAGTDGRATLRS